MGLIIRFVLVLGIACILLPSRCGAQAGLDNFDVNLDGDRLPERNGTQSGEPPKASKDSSIAEVFERVLDKEFPDKDPQEG